MDFYIKSRLLLMPTRNSLPLKVRSDLIDYVVLATAPLPVRKFCQHFGLMDSYKAINSYHKKLR